MTGLPKNRYQFHFPDNQFMDKDDVQQDLIALLNGPMKELKQFFKPEFAKGLTVGGEKFVVDSLTQGAIGKFIGLYGLDELIGSLPTGIDEFHIQNRDRNSNIEIVIPNEISRFKNLNLVFLDNCVSSIPDSICELTKLKYLALTNNPGLKTIPDCLENMENLVFINLQGSDNVQIPRWLEEKGNKMGNNFWDLGDDI
jgi:hypothetical protein